MSDSAPINYDAALSRIQADPRYLRNLPWGKPRGGHPEGTIAAHIAELERNLAALRPRLFQDEIPKLKLLIHTHDTFKPDAAAGAWIVDPRSHASLGRKFLAEFCDDPLLLAIVQNHDVAYSMWQNADRGRRPGDSARLDKLRRDITDWDLFLAFLIIDGCTEGKNREPLQWFFAQIGGTVETRWTAIDLL